MVSAVRIVGAAGKESPTTFFEIVFSGGPIGVAIMLALIALSMTAVYLIVEQILLLRRRLIVPDGLDDRVRQCVESGRMSEAQQICDVDTTVLGIVIAHGLAEADGGWDAIEKALEDSLADQAAKLFRRVEYLSVLANLAPMLGLLGTVFGMVLCFREVASTQGNAGAGQLAEGIYQALVTTVAGLMIAIPALGAFALLRNRVDQLIAEAAYMSQHALGPLKRRRSGTSRAVAASTPGGHATGHATPVGHATTAATSPRAAPPSPPTLPPQTPPTPPAPPTPPTPPSSPGGTRPPAGGR